MVGNISFKVKFGVDELKISFVFDVKIALSFFFFFIKPEIK